MSLPDWQSGRGNDRQSSFVFKNVTLAVVDDKDTLYIIKSIYKFIISPKPDVPM